jgi:hypothetical protein
MLLAWLPAAQPVGMPAALVLLATVALWQLRSGQLGLARWSGLADTAAMAALVALAGSDAETTGSAGRHGTHHTDATACCPTPSPWSWPGWRCGA